MTSAYSINLNFNNTIPVKTDFTFKQGDKGITLNLATTGLDTTGTTAKIVFKRSNGTSVEADLVGAGPTYSYTILGNEFEIPGVVVADLKLYNGDTQRVSTASFIFLVTGDTMDGVGGGTGGYSDQLEQLSEEFEDTLNEYKDAFGDVGAVNPRGAYDSTVDYNVLDLVSYQGSSYLCRTACKNKVPTNTTYWQVFASGGGTDDYDDLENKPSINGVELSGDKSTDDLGIEFNNLDDVDMAGATDGQVPTWDATAQKYKPGTPAGGGGGTNPNLLLNGWFTVNQEGFTSGVTNNNYNVDMWKSTYGTSAGSLALTSNGMQITPAANDAAILYQLFEDVSFLNGKTVTASMLLSDGTIIKGTINALDISTNTYFTSGDRRLRFVGTSSPKAFRVEVSTTAVTIRAVKLEIGSTSTLHLDTVPNYTTELLKCHRYYFRLTCAESGTYFLTGETYGEPTDTKCRWSVLLPTQMRILPNLDYGGTISVGVVGSSKTLSSLTVIKGSNNQQLTLFGTLTASVTSYTMCSLVLNSVGAYLAFDARL